MHFIHKTLEVPHLERVHIGDKRFYKKLDELKHYISMTTITSHFNKEKFASWRQKVGEEEANRITKAATNRGTKMHSLVENYLGNLELPKTEPLPKMLFDIALPELNKINNILGIEIPLYSDYLEIAGTCDCIAEYDGKLSIIDFKTSQRPKPREWIDGYMIQATGYACMLYEMTGIKCDQLVIIMSCENGEVETYIETDFKKYIKLLEVYINKFKEDYGNNN
jgi:hypothetical protein